MQPIPHTRRDSPETVYLAKYDWLLRWAMHFCGKDRDAAEDLVQDVFTQMLVSWSSIRDVEHPEKFLYTYLKYAYLLNLRRDRRYSFQALSAIDFESLHLSLRQEKNADPVELQDGLRSIVAYLSWRKHTAKSASILLLRFFHGFYPLEIMQIGLLTRKAVDGGLAQAREEAKAYVADPGRLHVMHGPGGQGGVPPAPAPMHLALPMDEFVGQLRQSIFHSPAGECLPHEVLRARYLGDQKTPIDCHLLAHLVSCARCLDIVSNLCGLPPLAKRSPEEAWGFAQRKKLPGSKVTEITAASASRSALLSMEAGRSRYRDSFEHRPQALMIAVDGHVRASRDVSCSVSHLKLEMPSLDGVELVEVLSEQELPLLTLPVPGLPPEVSPVLCQRVALSGGRTAELLLRFGAQGALLELTYCDPFFEAVERVEDRAATAVTPGLVLPEAERTRGLRRGPQQFLQDLWRRLWRMRSGGRSQSPRLLPCAAGATVLLLVAILALAWFKHPRPVSPEVLLRRTAGAETALRVPGARGVAYQRVRITAHGAAAPDRVTDRRLYRDLERKRHPRQMPMAAGEKALEVRMAQAGIGWENPLSAVAFHDWHGRADVARDTVVQAGPGLVTLTTTLKEGSIASESLTVRTSDDHPVARTVRYADNERIEVAELEYRVLSWADADAEWFEPESAGAGMPAPGTRASRAAVPAPQVLTETELDGAELGARVALAELQADTSERLHLERTSRAVLVRGIVAEPERLHEIRQRLRQVPHVEVSIRTFDEAEADDATRATSLALHPAEQGMSPLDEWMAERNIPAAAGGHLAHALFESSASARQRSRSAVELEHRFRSSALEVNAKSMLRLLESEQWSGLEAALEQQEKALEQLGISIPKDASVNIDDPAAAVQLAAETNGRLCSELMTRAQRDASAAGGASSAPRSPRVILNDLATSLARMKQIHLQQQEADRSLSAFSTGRQEARVP